VRTLLVNGFKRWSDGAMKHLLRSANVVSQGVFVALELIYWLGSLIRIASGPCRPMMPMLRYQ
jgi:hypothetical protein